MNHRDRLSIVKMVVLLLMVFFVSFLHYYTPTTKEFLHNIYQRLYYIPIIISCFWFGLKGGLFMSLFAGALYGPHILIHWRHETPYIFNQIIEIVMFFLIAFLVGTLYDMEKRLKERYKKISEERDATLRQLQETFERLRLADRLSTLGKLSAEMTHEIKNPLAGMYGSMEIIEKEFKKDHPKYEFVQILKREIDRIARIVHKYLDFARPHQPEKSQHNINPLIRSIVEIISKQADKKEVDIKLRLTPSLPDIFIDAQQIKQAIMNILINGIQATPKRQSVSVASGRSGSNIFVSIQDGGEGISEKDLGKIFDPLFTTKKDGTGLGLSIAYQIINQHDGEITVQNSERGGAIFTIFLPIDARSHKNENWKKDLTSR